MSTPGQQPHQPGQYPTQGTSPQGSPQSFPPPTGQPVVPGSGERPQQYPAPTPQWQPPAPPAGSQQGNPAQDVRSGAHPQGTPTAQQPRGAGQPVAGQQAGQGATPYDPSRPQANPSAPAGAPQQARFDPTPAPAQQQARSEVREAAQLLGEAIQQVQRVIVGQEHMVEQLMVGLLAKGHILLEGVPGVAKTLAVRSFATVVGGDFARVQFTPDLVPSDITGTRIYSAQRESFDVELGPVFVNFVLADEINRAPAKVQAAMLELMAEKQVSIAGTTYPAPKPFIVIATQNPVESEGVYPLPEAQRDRFLLKVDVPYPRGNEEFEILRRMSVRPPEPTRVLDPERVIALQDMASNVFVHNLVAEYVVRLVLATRNPGDFGMPDLDAVIQIGCSPRATLGLVAASRALALIHGRDYVLPTDVQAVARDVMSHRLVLSFDAVADNIDATQVVDRILAMVPPPTPVWNQQQSGPRPEPQR